jgi:hypothetical protein
VRKASLGDSSGALKIIAPIEIQLDEQPKGAVVEITQSGWKRSDYFRGDGGRGDRNG